MTLQSVVLCNVMVMSASLILRSDWRTLSRLGISFLNVMRYEQITVTSKCHLSKKYDVPWSTIGLTTLRAWFPGRVPAVFDSVSRLAGASTGA
jgi:hypothetical protein